MVGASASKILNEMADARVASRPFRMPSQTNFATAKRLIPSNPQGVICSAVCRRVTTNLLFDMACAIFNRVVEVNLNLSF